MGRAVQPIKMVMGDTVWIQGRYESAYGLLGAMAAELQAGMVEAGHDARLIDLVAERHPTDGVFVFFNAPLDLDALPRGLWTGGGVGGANRLRAVQVFVDHPFALPDSALDEWDKRTGLANFRMCLPCADDLHLLRMRWPQLEHAWMGHGIPASALCPAEGISRRAWDAKEFDVVVTGSIVGEAEIRDALAQMPAPMAGMVREIAAVMLADAGVGYLQAMDLVMGSRGVMTGDWELARRFWRTSIAMVNRLRRVRAVQSLQGLKVGVFGSDRWGPVCEGTIRYAGKLGYADIAGAFTRGRVGLAWGPTQFVHSYSERIMLAMAAGSAAVSDDRLLVRRDFAGACGLYNAARPESARSACDRLLGDTDAAVAMAARGRALVEEKCLWRHRVGAIVGAAVGEEVR